MQTKYKIDRKTRTQILIYIQKYSEYRSWYDAERSRILYPSTKQADGMPRGGYVGNPTLSAAEKLERLEGEHRTRVIRAIDQARHLIGVDIQQTLEQEEILRKYIWLSCESPREYPFESFAGLVACERAQFYRYKNKFMNDIKSFLGL